MTVGVLLLAAGRSRRFGADKRYSILPGGQRLIDATIARVHGSGLPLLVCLDCRDGDLEGELHEAGIACCLCRHAEAGMGASLAEAVGQLPSWEGVLIALADMPWVSAATYSMIAENLSPERICVPEFGGQPGHPVGFGREFFAELAKLGGDIGARSVVLRHAQRVHRVAVDDAGIVQDIDRPEDLQTATPGE